ncbi:hypothetical protein MHU86_9898 [Fragilaria crotonensis]|nr:hypothetical protein MHU86_9898 [Fragilaria crotonensis]
MARGKEGKARRKEQRKDAQKTVADMIDASNDVLDGSEEDDDLPLPPPRARSPPTVETVDEDEDDDDGLVLPTPSKKSKSKAREGKSGNDTKYTNRAVKAAGASSGPSRGIKTTPLILLVLMIGTTLIPALIYASDFLGSYLAKNNVLGSIGYRLGIGQTPKKRVLSFYEKHDPLRLPKYQRFFPSTMAITQVDQESGTKVPGLWLLFGVGTGRSAFNCCTAVRNIQYNVGTLIKKFRKAWKKQIWPQLEPFFGVPKGTAAQKRKDAQELKRRKAAAGGTKKRRKNNEFRDDIEEEM